ncbi:CapA family protein [Propioniciclava sp. MC1595]|uniref:CapA family protein n=1 Tax=Propioniciclava sp. MC1595 TaxID=2760308 RepID=UPI001662259B|nr:CapA family protein [Propioniciclava sp. MC1595]MBB1494478.1 CapA family protein [Propioniciclava sp. MC1595]QTE27151.1 CapA family protein [Propioniciclava sp. MC1595]
MAPVLFLRALAAAGTAGVLVLAVNAVATIGPGSAGSAPGAIVPALPDPGPVPGQPLVGDDPVTIAFAGDVHFEKQLAPVAADPQGLASLSPHLGAADLTIVNLESAVTDGGGRRMAGKQFTFATPPSGLTTLSNAGVDVVSLANNHGVDFGAKGLEQTLAARAGSPVAMVGIGANAAEAFAPSVHTVDGVSIAVLAATQLRDHTTVYFRAGEDKAGVASMEDPERLLAAVREAAATHDVVVVVPHWGVEKHTCPSAKQVAAARQLADAGADVVVGGHSHRVMGSGWLGDTYVGYGLGNFVWFRNTTFPGRSTGVLTVEVDKGQVAAKRKALAQGEPSPGPVVVRDAWQPLSITASGIPAADPETAQQMLADRGAALACSGLDAAPRSAPLVATAPGR